MNNILFTLGLTVISCTIISANTEIVQLDVQHWNDATLTWENTIRYLYDYDQEGSIEAETRQLWDTITLAWINVEKKIRKFNVQQLPTVIAKQTWTGNNWKDQFRRTYTYQINNGRVQKSTMIVNSNADQRNARRYTNISSFEMQRWQVLQVRYTKAWFKQKAAFTAYHSEGTMINASISSCTESSEFTFENDEDGHLIGFLKFIKTGGENDKTLMARGAFNEMAFPEQDIKTNVRKDLVIYPNPSVDYIRFNLFKTATKEILVNLFDEYGRSIYFRSVDPLLISDEFIELNIQRFPAGMYTITVQAGNFLQSGKFVKIQE